MGLFARRKPGRKSGIGAAAAAAVARSSSKKKAAGGQEALLPRNVAQSGTKAGISFHGSPPPAVTASSSSSTSTHSSVESRQQPRRLEMEEEPASVEGQFPPSFSSPPASADAAAAAPAGPYAALRRVPTLIADLRCASDPSGERPARALRTLFALSEHSGGGGGATNTDPTKNRIELVGSASGGELIPALMEFLELCGRGSSEQYLCLLVLNNVSIPQENKRLIAIDHGGARALSRHLVADPSCHLLAIVLVNLSFSDADLRRELAAPSSDAQLVDALAFALRVSCKSADEGEEVLTGTSWDEARSPRKMLSSLASSERSRGGGDGTSDSPFDPSDLLYPETARWCLCALKNLTRPSSAVRDPLAAFAVMESGTAPVALRIATASPDRNNPATWDANSAQDAALTIVLNLVTSTAAAAARKHLIERGAVDALISVADFEEVAMSSEGETEGDGRKWLRLQRLKARMIIALLLASEGHFGQPRRHLGSPESHSFSKSLSGDGRHPAMAFRPSEPEAVVQLLADALHQRSKDGPGGYSATTFTARGIIVAVRCLLTVDENRNSFTADGGGGKDTGTKLNALLIKAVAMHSLVNSSSMDAEAAEQACWSLYLMSEFGFQAPFMPTEIGPGLAFDDRQHHPRRSGGLAEKILASYKKSKGITPAGHHAADQLLKRLQYLTFEGTAEALGTTLSPASDFNLSDDLLQVTEAVVLEKQRSGAAPRDDIFDRPILRSKTTTASPQHTESRQSQEGISPLSVMEEFPSALRAVQHLSFGSTSVRHLDTIDDVHIANSIAQSADEYTRGHSGDGGRSESYNYTWRWLDEVDEDVSEERRADRQAMPHGKSEAPGRASLKDFLTKMTSKTFSDDATADEPMSIFGFKCCSLDVPR